ncbi:MAG TPA: iron-sulfur cluster assembly accessory protein [Micavibrio sp.]|nr:iron-sulfur cluster assembly accessory protein [Micavibrio sp.]HIL27738.1 iron-sulfur cluster assembly accessory protein [Micavibrio sp.]
MSLISVTDRAAEELAKRTGLNPAAIGIRLMVTNTGCSGHSYKMEHVTEESDKDDKFAHENAIIFVPKEQLLYLIGTEIDFKEDGLASNFVFNNPNAEGTCGCGESFNLKIERD